jgi:hypothetical protein
MLSARGLRLMRWAGATFALVLFLLGILASESVFARGGGRGGGSHGAGFHGGGHRGAGFHGGNFHHGGGFHGGKHFHHGAGFHGGKHFHHGGFHHGHGRVGVFIGAPVVLGGLAHTWPYYPPPPYYYPAAPYYPPTYVEQGVPQQPAPLYWYYCPNTNAYYPYVKECPGGWQQVAPQPPPS